MKTNNPFDLAAEERTCKNCNYKPNDGKCTGMNCYQGIKEKLCEKSLQKG